MLQIIAICFFTTVGLYFLRSVKMNLFLFDHDTHITIDKKIAINMRHDVPELFYNAFDAVWIFVVNHRHASKVHTVLQQCTELTRIIIDCDWLDWLEHIPEYVRELTLYAGEFSDRGNRNGARIIRLMPQLTTLKLINVRVDINLFARTNIYDFSTNTFHTNDIHDIESAQIARLTVRGKIVGNITALKSAIGNTVISRILFKDCEPNLMDNLGVYFINNKYTVEVSYNGVCPAGCREICVANNKTWIDDLRELCMCTIRVRWTLGLRNYVAIINLILPVWMQLVVDDGVVDLIFLA